MSPREVICKLFLQLVVLQYLIGANRVMRAPVLVKNEELIASLKVDGQEVHLLVDTGASSLFLIWKTWYTKEYKESCSTTIFGCYECHPSPCIKGPTEVIKFVEGSNVTVFGRSGSFKLGNTIADGIKFGLVCGFQSPGLELWASLGLGQLSTTPGGPITQQLADKGLITAASSSIYIKPDGDRLVGEVIFGGEDKSKYDGRLRPIKVVSSDFVKLLSISLEGIMIPFGTEYAKIDSGTNNLEVPYRFESQLIALLRKSIQIDEKGDQYIFRCSDSKSLPSITYTFMGLQGEGIDLEVSLGALLAPYKHDMCYLLFNFVDDNAWTLGSIAFINNYLSFNWGKSRISVAKVK